jgi:hypothetical protein
MEGVQLDGMGWDGIRQVRFTEKKLRGDIEILKPP